ncbi:MAG: ATP-binding protein [Fibrobacter sp.]|nr:ATP-binding protein [Fibrobacter sp.]
MLNNAEIRNYGPLQNLSWSNPGKINLIIGANSTGKTFLLKALYCSIKTLEEYKRGDDQRSANEILADKLYWTFQVDKIGDLVSKGAEKPLHCNVAFGNQSFFYNFGKETSKQILSLENHVSPRTSNSIFLPAKEVLSLHQIILKSREQDKLFGFDDTYLDLARALRTSPQRGKNYTGFSESRKKLEDILGGKIEYDELSGRWQFKKGNQKFPIGVTAEGIKKIAILDTLLSNRYLDTDSIVLIDEPEAALHPKAVSDFLEIITILAESGIQFFMASHSYFVIKKLFLIAQEKQMSIPIIIEDQGIWEQSDLVNGMPDNTIIDESIRLYRDEVELGTK